MIARKCRSLYADGGAAMTEIGRIDDWVGERGGVLKAGRPEKCSRTLKADVALYFNTKYLYSDYNLSCSQRNVEHGSTTHSATTAGSTYQGLFEPVRLSTLAFRRTGFE